MSAQKQINTQLKRVRAPVSVEGFNGIVSCAHARKMVSLVREKESVDGWLEYPSADGKQAVEWDTAAAPGGACAAAFSWTCFLGGGQGPFDHRLFLDGSELLRFQTPLRRKRVWRGKGCVLRFDCARRLENGEEYGVMTLTVPASLLRPGIPVRIKVMGGVTNVHNYSFFALLNFNDTVAYEAQKRMGALQLADAGRAMAVIVCPRGATRVERFAAGELRRYVQAISGVLLPIKTSRCAQDRNAVFVGMPGAIRGMEARFCLPAVKDDYDRICLRTIPGALALSGSSPRSVLFAVYRFLHCLGCRWFEPGPYGERIPRERNLRVNALDLVETPSFKIRTSRPTEDQYIYTATDIRRHIDWAAKQGMNWFLFLIPAYERLRPVIVAEMRKRGMLINVGNHNFKKWLPHSLHGRHPEFFPEVNGARIRGGSARCASNKAGVALWAANAAAWARKYPEIDEISLCCDDGHVYCQCAGCRKLLPIEQLQIFYNAAARAIHRIQPGKRIMILSYTGHYEPSRRIKPYKRNVTVHVDTFSRCQVHALNDPACNKMNNQAESYNTSDVRANSMNRYLCLALRKWRELFRDVMIFENVVLHGRRSTPFPLSRVLAADLRYYKDIGIAGFAPQADLIRWAPATREQYIAARLVWNVESDWKELCHEFDGYYGAASRPMRRYFDYLENRLAGCCAEAQIINVLTAADIARCRVLLEKAQNLARSPQARIAVARTAFVFKYTALLWQLRQVHAQVDDLWRRGLKSAARHTRSEAVACARRLVMLCEQHQYENLALFSRGHLRGLLEDCLNGYAGEIVRPRVDVMRLLKNGVSLQNADSVAQYLAARTRWQARKHGGADL